MDSIVTRALLLVLVLAIAVPAHARMLKTIVDFGAPRQHMRAQTTTWNPSDKCANITLSSGNQLATGGTPWCTVRATTSFTVGATTKRVFNITVTTTASNYWISGIADGSLPLTDYVGQANKSFGWQSDATNNCYIAGYATFNGPCNSQQDLNAAGRVEWIAIDFNTGSVWLSNNCTAWYAGSTAESPDVGTIPNATFAAGTVFYPAAALGTSGNSATLNTYPSLAGCSNVNSFVPWDW
jgi:hypothetical protein